MKKIKQFIRMLSIVALLFVFATACDKSDNPGGDFPIAGTVKDADGNKYNTIKIGNQVWMIENLKTTKYNDGTKIPYVTDNSEWVSLTTGAYCNHNNLESNAKIYGKLYNWHAVNTGKLAPKGWRVPTDDDWTILENYLIANGYNYDNTTDKDKVAKSLCAKTNWTLSSEVGTPGAALNDNNRTGFTALPGGSRNGLFLGGYFSDLGNSGTWWCCTEHDDFGYYRKLYYDEIFLFSSVSTKAAGYSVRLIKE